MKPETRFHNAVHKLLPQGIHYEKMNNPFRSGTADFWYSSTLDLWIEYKWLNTTPKKPFKADLSPLQQKWLRGRYKEGRNVAVVIGCPDGIMILRDLVWENPVPPAFIHTRQSTADWISKEVKHVCHPQSHHSRKSDKLNLPSTGDNSTNRAPSHRSRLGGKTKQEKTERLW